MADFNGTLPEPVVPAQGNETSILTDPGPVYASYSVGYFLIGLAITLASSLLNALGVNLQKLDHVRAHGLPPDQRRKEWLRPVWVLGLSLYILSQVLGSTLALQYMRAEYVAPLGSSSLIFNFLFARWLLGTRITRLDLAGTLVIVLGVVGVVGFGNIRLGDGGIDQDANMSLSTLQTLWGRGAWLGYLVGLEVVTAATWWVASVMDEVVVEREAEEVERDEDDDVAELARRGGRRLGSADRSSFLRRVVAGQRRFRNSTKGRLETWASSRPDASLRKLCGLFWSLAAGLMAGQTLIFAKSFVKVVSNATDHSGRGSGTDLVHPLTILIAIFLVVTAIAQVWCLNRGLRVFDSTLVVPVLFASYTASGWVDTLIYLDELPFYRNWVLSLITFSIVLLVVGVVMLSSKKPEAHQKSAEEVEEERRKWDANADPEGEAQGTSLGSTFPPSQVAPAGTGRGGGTRPRSGSVMSLKELGERLAEPFRKRRRSSAASGVSVAARSSRSPSASASASGDRSFSRVPDKEDEEEDEVDGLPSYGEARRADDGKAADEDEDDEDFGGFVDAKS